MHTNRCGIRPGTADVVTLNDHIQNIVQYYGCLGGSKDGQKTGRGKLDKLDEWTKGRTKGSGMHQSGQHAS